MPDASSNERRAWDAALGRTSQCLPPEEIAAMVSSPDTAGDPARREHLASCPHCRHEAALLRDFEFAEPKPEESASLAWIQSQLRERSAEFGPVQEKNSRWQTFTSWLGAALAVPRLRTATVAFATLAIAITAGVYFKAARQGTLPPDVNGPMVWRSGQLQVIAPIGDIAAPPAEFQWQPLPGAARYRVKLLEVDRTEIWSHPVTATRVIVPSEIRARMTAGRSFLWQVIAQDSSGVEMGQTNLQSFHISITHP